MTARQGPTWAAVRGLMRLAPATGLRLMLGGLSTRPATQVLAAGIAGAELLESETDTH